jgi:hypothetical protein
MSYRLTILILCALLSLLEQVAPQMLVKSSTTNLLQNSTLKSSKKRAQLYANIEQQTKRLQ